jgi:hypothetical protein
VFCVLKEYADPLYHAAMKAAQAANVALETDDLDRDLADACQQADGENPSQIGTLMACSEGSIRARLVPLAASDAVDAILEKHARLSGLDWPAIVAASVGKEPHRSVRYWCNLFGELPTEIDQGALVGWTNEGDAVKTLYFAVSGGNVLGGKFVPMSAEHDGGGSNCWGGSPLPGYETLDSLPDTLEGAIAAARKAIDAQYDAALQVMRSTPAEA